MKDENQKKYSIASVRPSGDDGVHVNGRCWCVDLPSPSSRSPVPMPPVSSLRLSLPPSFLLLLLLVSLPPSLVPHPHVSRRRLALVSQHQLVPFQLGRFPLAPDGSHLGVKLRLGRLGFLQLPPQEAPLPPAKKEEQEEEQRK